MGSESEPTEFRGFGAFSFDGLPCHSCLAGLASTFPYCFESSHGDQYQGAHNILGAWGLGRGGGGGRLIM